ncbi:MAG: hypothetical protein Q9195_000655 [Heterodermia aff. obscurata]
MASKPLQDEPEAENAVLRPRYYQLEMLEESKKLIFVLVPTVALAAQWYNVVSAQLPAISVRFLSGADGVDRWGDKWIWDEFLQGVRVVVCTYQVLRDFPLD